MESGIGEKETIHECVWLEQHHTEIFYSRTMLVGKLVRICLMNHVLC